MLELLENWLRHKSDMVNFEAARAMCEMKNVSAAQISRPVAGLCHADCFFLAWSMTPWRTSSTNLPLFTETHPKIRRYPHSGLLGAHTPRKRCLLQRGSRRIDL
jgi:hypothetical protein